MSDDPFGSLDPSSTGGPIEEPRLGFLSRLFRRRKQDPSQLPEGGMLEFDSGPPEGNQGPAVAESTPAPTPTPTPRPVGQSSTTPSPTPPARLGSAPPQMPGQTTPPTWPQPVRVSSSGGFPVGVIVVILIVVAVFGIGIVSCIAAFDEGFDTADEAFDSAFSNDFTAPNPDPDLEAGDPVPPAEYIPEFGSDENFDRLANGCFEGNMGACDQLYASTPISPDESYEGYGERCGGRVDRDISAQCVATFGERIED